MSTWTKVFEMKSRLCPVRLTPTCTVKWECLQLIRISLLTRGSVALTNSHALLMILSCLFKRKKVCSSTPHSRTYCILALVSLYWFEDRSKFQSKLVLLRWDPAEVLLLFGLGWRLEIDHRWIHRCTARSVEISLWAGKVSSGWTDHEAPGPYKR